MNIWNTLQQAVDQHPSKIGIVEDNLELTYHQLGEQISNFASFLLSRLNLGDRISILDVNSTAYYETYYAAAGSGMILNPLNYRLSGKELSDIVIDAGSRILIASDQFAPHVQELIRHSTPLELIIWTGELQNISQDIPHISYADIINCNENGFAPEPVSSDQIAHLYYTSGTTGKPKGVILTHNNVYQHALGTIAELQLTDSDRWGHIAPMFHLADAWATFAITMVGGTHIILPRFDPEITLKAIQNKKITISNLIPTMLNLMVKSPIITEYDLSSLRVILSGGAPIAPEVVRRIIDSFGCDYIQTYGMTETSPYLTLSLLNDRLKQLPFEQQLRYKSKTGRPFITVDLKVVREDGSPVKTDDKEVGEILVIGETVTPGYWNRPDETERAFKDGWLCTGDLATIDCEGYVNIVDRKKDMIISGGENIYSIEVENVLYRHPKILEVAVFGSPHDIWGEKVTAAVVLQPDEDVSSDELIEFCKLHLSAFKVPRSIRFMPELPKTGSGKIFKKGLKRG